MDEHPFLVSHNKLTIIKKENKKNDEMPGYSDTGGACNSNLFEDEKNFILIECNGTIYSISKKGGKIEKIGRSRMYKLPINYVGTFEKRKNIYSQDGYAAFSVNPTQLPHAVILCPIGAVRIKPCKGEIYQHRATPYAFDSPAYSPPIRRSTSSPRSTPLTVCGC